MFEPSAYQSSHDVTSHPLTIYSLAKRGAGKGEGGLVGLDDTEVCQRERLASDKNTPAGLVYNNKNQGRGIHH